MAVNFRFDPSSENRLLAVNPILQGRIREMAYRLNIQNVYLRVVQGFRSWRDQQKLWLKGRNEKGEVVSPADVVTHAPPGHSWHEFGLAVDVVPAHFLDAPDWHAADPLWQKIQFTGEDLGLFPGAKFTHPDKPHFQLTGKFGLSPDDEVRGIFLQAGMAAVWHEAGLG